jgi:hypothetical protein
LTGFVLWNIFRFAIPMKYPFKYRIIFISVIALATGALMIAIETIVVFLSYPSIVEDFVSTIPVRVFITFLIVLIFYLSSLFLYENTEFERNDIQKDSMDSIKITDTEKSEMDHTSSHEPMNSSDSPSAKSVIDRITVRSGQKIIIIPVESILYIKADGDYIMIHTTDGKWLKEQTMKYTEDRLPADTFVRIHRSYIVNVHRISRIERYGEKQLIVLHNNEKIKISPTRYQTLKQVLGL